HRPELVPHAELRVDEEERDVGPERVDPVEERAHLLLEDLPRRRRLRLHVDHLAVAARHYVVVAAVRRMRDAEPPGGRASELAGEGRGDVPLERAAEGADARVAQPVAAPGDALDQAGADQEPTVARRDG